MGSIRTSALFGSAPFIGVILSLLFLREAFNPMLLASLPFMVVGAIFLFTENHAHFHTHEYLEHNHKHSHTDGHHDHLQDETVEPIQKYHSHNHSHQVLVHDHPHLPDIHHRHTHKK
jgi:hypothetical protein